MDRPARMTGRGDLWENRFGHAAPFSLGVEEELLLVGADDELADQSARIVRDTDTAQGDVDRELFKAMSNRDPRFRPASPRRSPRCATYAESCSCREPASSAPGFTRTRAPESAMCIKPIGIR
jgi:hypothetical protein